MVANSKVNRIAGLSLAAAVAGTLTLVPVAKADTTSQSTESTTSKAPVVSTEDTSSSAPVSPSTSATATPSSESATAVRSVQGSPKASTSKAAPTTTADPVQEWAEILKSFASLIVSATAAGSGTSGVQYTSDNHTYSAVASNPANGRLYAVSNEGHLLRIHPQTGNLTDLGEIPGVDAEKITSAAFTQDGTLVLIDVDTVYTKDLADDEVGPRSTLKNLEFAKKAIDTEREVPKLAWAPTDSADELVALAVEDDKATRYTLNVKDEKATVSEAPADVEKGVDLAEVKAFEYAYLADDATFFADGEGNAVKFEDGKIVDVETDRTNEDNYKAVAGLEPEPESTASDTPAAAADTPTVSPTTTAEPTPSTKAPSVGQRDPEVIELDVEVVTDDGRSVQGAEFVSTDGAVEGITDETGKGKVTLKLDDASRGKDTFNLAIDVAPEGWGGSVAEVQRGAKSVKFVLPKGENASQTTTVTAPKNAPSSTTTKKAAGQGDDELIEISVLVKTADDKLVEGAEFKSEDGTVAGTTDANGRGKIYIETKKENAKLVRLTLKEAPKGYKNAEIVVRRGDTEAELVLPRDPNATPSSTLSKPDQVLKVLDQVRPVASSFLAPAAALAGVGGLAGAGGSKSTKSTKTTKTTFGGTSVTNTRRSTGRSTSVKPSAKVVTRSGNSTKVAKSTSTTRTISSDKERDDDLADTGTPMRAIIALGVLSVLIGGAYLALGRRRENQ